MPLDLGAFDHMTKLAPEYDESIVERLRFDDALDVPHQLTDVDVWLNYCNDDLYNLDKAVRIVINKTRWSRKTKGYMKTAVPLMFMQIFGRRAEDRDSHVCKMMHRILEYYCTSFTGTTKIAGQRFNRVYYFSKYACRSKRPMSLRLRLEESNGSDNSFREYNAGEDKRKQSRRGVAPHGPLADERGRLPE